MLNMCIYFKKINIAANPQGTWLWIFYMLYPFEFCFFRNKRLVIWSHLHQMMNIILEICQVLARRGWKGLLQVVSILPSCKNKMCHMLACKEEYARSNFKHLPCQSARMRCATCSLVKDRIRSPQGSFSPSLKEETFHLAFYDKLQEWSASSLLREN